MRLYWEDRSKEFPQYKGKKALVIKDNGATFVVGDFTKEQHKAAVVAFRRGMELGMRVAHNDIRKVINSMHNIPEAGGWR